MIISEDQYRKNFKNIITIIFMRYQLKIIENKERKKYKC